MSHEVSEEELSDILYHINKKFSPTELYRWLCGVLPPEARLPSLCLSPREMGICAVHVLTQYDQIDHLREVLGLSSSRPDNSPHKLLQRLLMDLFESCSDFHQEFHSFHSNGAHIGTLTLERLPDPRFADKKDYFFKASEVLMHSQAINEDFIQFLSDTQPDSTKKIQTFRALYLSGAEDRNGR
ncbi:MAG: hypothetical protein AAFV53_01405 [Myxococcota bacterium]